MTVKEFISENPGLILHLLTPVGYVDLGPEQAKSLLEGNKTVSTHPGCEGSDMVLPAEVVLFQFICTCNMDQANHQCHILTADEPPEEAVEQTDEDECLGIQMM